MTRFELFREEVLRSMQNHSVQYKLFGGGAVTLMLNHRETTDLDMALKNDRENKERFIDALVACGFGDKEYIDAHMRLLEEEESLENRVVQVKPLKSEWANYHIDLAIQMGKYTYETLGDAATVEKNGIIFNLVPLRKIGKMKAEIHDPDTHAYTVTGREQDFKDMDAIMKYLESNPDIDGDISLKKEVFTKSSVFSKKN